MRLAELLMEVKVDSSWISELVYNRPNKILTLKLLSGRTYLVYNVSRRLFDKWKMAPSRGRFWHLFIKMKYRVVRIK
jgi:hypothetical protein